MSQDADDAKVLVINNEAPRIAKQWTRDIGEFKDVRGPGKKYEALRKVASLATELKAAVYKMAVAQSTSEKKQAELAASANMAVNQLMDFAHECNTDYGIMKIQFDADLAAKTVTAADKPEDVALHERLKKGYKAQLVQQLSVRKESDKGIDSLVDAYTTIHYYVAVAAGDLELDMALKMALNQQGDWMFRRYARVLEEILIMAAVAKTGDCTIDKEQYKRMLLDGLTNREAPSKIRETEELRTALNTSLAILEYRAEQRGLKLDGKPAVKDELLVAAAKSGESREDRECYHCGMKGHLKRDCRKLKKEQKKAKEAAKEKRTGGRARSNDRCYNCQGSGHRAAGCASPDCRTNTLSNEECKNCKGKGHNEAKCTTPKKYAGTKGGLDALKAAIAGLAPDQLNSLTRMLNGIDAGD